MQETIPEDSREDSRDKIREEAAQWLERWDELDQRGFDEFKLWLAQDDIHRKVFTGLWRLYHGENLEQALQKAETLRVRRLKPLSPKLSPRSSPKLNWVWLPTSGAVAAALLLVALWLKPDTPVSVGETAQPLVAQSYSTNTAERERIQLADKSQIDMNANTRLDATLNDSQRKVRLYRGEAFFAVAKDPLRPFEVSTPSAKIQVLGTAFNVNQTPGELTVTVVEGHVQVFADRRLDLYAGDELTVRGGNAEQVQSSGNGQDAVAWRNGVISVYRKPLHEVLDSLQNYLPKPVLVNAAFHTEPTVSGRFLLDEPEKSLYLIASLNKLTVTEAAEAYYLSAP